MAGPAKEEGEPPQLRLEARPVLGTRTVDTLTLLTLVLLVSLHPHLLPRPMQVSQVSTSCSSQPQSLAWGPDPTH